MRDRLRHRPQVEGLESKDLLSNAAMLVPHTAPLVAAHFHQVMPPVAQVIQLAGTVHGFYFARSFNPSMGTTFSFFSGPSQISPLGLAGLSGTIHSPASGQSTGIVFIGSPFGALTLQVTGPAQNASTPSPDVFSYTITRAAGRFRGDTGSGFIDLTLSPNSFPPFPFFPFGPFSAQSGRFSMTFLTTPPPVTG